jgi:hypothetical protein
MVFPHFLKTAEIFVADRVSFVKGRAFEFSRTNLGHVMGQPGSHRFFQFNFFQHDLTPNACVRTVEIKSENLTTKARKG